MADQGGVRFDTTVPHPTKPTIEVEGLTAQYSTGCTPTGEWFALGTIARNGKLKTTPAWVVVGTGTTKEEAVQSLTSEVRLQAVNHAPT